MSSKSEKEARAKALAMRHPAAMSRTADIWAFVDRSTVVAEKVKQGRFVGFR
jgi:hypothetical protein